MQLLLLSIALAMDSVALSMANGARHHKITFLQIFLMAFLFGLFQAIMPAIGYVLGIGFAHFIANVDHFIAFVILAFLGLKMIKESKQRPEDINFSLGLGALILGAVATSIDAFAVGVTFSFEHINLLFSVIVIGVTCSLLCVAASYVGRYVGEKLESKAMMLGGVILILLGCKILFTHLFGLE